MRITPEIKITLNELCSTLAHPPFPCGDAVINAVSTDSRELSRSDIFITLKGENEDGRRYINEAKAKGAIVISDTNNSDIHVENVDKAISKIINLYLKNADNLNPKS